MTREIRLPKVTKKGPVSLEEASHTPMGGIRQQPLSQNGVVGRGDVPSGDLPSLSPFRTRPGDGAQRGRPKETLRCRPRTGDDFTRADRYRHRSRIRKNSRPLRPACRSLRPHGSGPRGTESLPPGGCPGSRRGDGGCFRRQGGKGSTRHKGRASLHHPRWQVVRRTRKYRTYRLHLQLLVFVLL